MKAIAHIELLRKTLDDMTDEHPMERGAWPIYRDILEDLDKLEHEMNRMDLLDGEKQ